MEKQKFIKDNSYKITGIIFIAIGIFDLIYRVVTLADFFSGIEYNSTEIFETIFSVIIGSVVTVVYEFGLGIYLFQDSDKRKDSMIYVPFFLRALYYAWLSFGNLETDFSQFYGYLVVFVINGLAAIAILSYSNKKIEKHSDKLIKIFAIVFTISVISGTVSFIIEYSQYFYVFSSVMVLDNILDIVFNIALARIFLIRAFGEKVKMKTFIKKTSENILNVNANNVPVNNYNNAVNNTGINNTNVQPIKTMSEKLKEINALLEANEITQEEYDKMRAEIINII